MDIITAVLTRAEDLRNAGRSEEADAIIQKFIELTEELLEIQLQV